MPITNKNLFMFLGLFVFIGLVLSTWFGLGWLFISIAFQRLVMFIPITRNKIQQIFSIPIVVVGNKKVGHAHKILQTMSIIGWFALEPISKLRICASR